MSSSESITDRLSLLQVLTELEINYWYEVDHNWGRNAHDFYAADGSFTIGDKIMRGTDAIAGFYRWREARGERVARHIVTNFRLGAMRADQAAFECILCLHAADGRPVLPSQPPIMIADIRSECARGADGRWYYHSHTLIPVFEGGEPATVPKN
jgi:hypothetical protein